jgi:hypothetical protein
MTDEEIVSYLDDNGYPPHIVRAGREGLIERWREFAREVEQGYPYGLEEYRHDLDLRGAIAVAGLDVDPKVQEADERLQNLLIGEHRVWESFAGEAFWDFGYPKNASGRLLRDLRAAGFVD